MYENQVIRKRLDSWKSIALYLGKHERTVIRWEKKNALPVHRIRGGPKQPVFAYSDEIDAWLVGQDKTESEHAGLLEKNEKGQNLYNSQGSNSDAVPLLPRESNLRRSTFLFIIAGLITVVAAMSKIILNVHRSPRPFHVTQLTDDGRFKFNLRADARSLYFNEKEGNREVLVSSTLTGKNIRKIYSPFPNVDLQDVSVDGQYLLGLSFIGTEQERTLWYVPVEDGSPDRIGSFACRLVRRSPDNHWIACVSGTAVILADRDGHRIRQLAAFPFPLENLGWTPDGRALRVSLLNTSSRDFWEIRLSSQGNTLAPSTPVRLELGENCCSSWGWFDDGRQFAYMKPGADGEQSLFVRPAHSSWTDWARSESEIPVKIGALQEVASMKDGTTLYLLIQGAWRGQLLKYDVSKKGFTTFLPGLTAGYLSFSPDGQWITYIDDHQALWRSRSDGTQAVKISGDIQPVQLSSWSPDGKKIAFMGLKPGRPWRIFIVGRDGGEPVEAVTGDDNQGTPTWSPDGRKLAYGNVLCNDTQSCWIRILDLQTGAVEKLPESHGFRTARWSPDGRWIAALVPETHQLMLFDVNHKRWRPLADAVTGDTVNWSRNSRFVYADSSLAERPIIERFRVLDGRRNTAVSLEEVQKIPGQIDFWFGLDPSDTPFVVHRFNASEVYAMDWK